MKLGAGLIERGLDATVFAIWAIFLNYLLVSQRYEIYLRPEFGLLLVIALYVSLGFMLAAVVRSKATKSDLSHIFRVLVLLTPVLYAMTLPDAKLGNMAFQTRYTGPTNLRTDTNSQSTFHPQEAGKAPGSQPGRQESLQENPPLERSILEIFRSPGLYEGKRVIVKGMIVREDKIKKHFGELNSAVYRFLITCCAADAVPLAIAINSDHIEPFTNDQWVEVEGIFDLQQINGKTVPVLINPFVKTIEEPSIPYMF